ncbi:hypothetical protein ACVNPZ_15605 [Staphylococcus aureus]
MKTKTGIAMALIKEREILVLDKPCNRSEPGTENTRTLENFKIINGKRSLVLFKSHLSEIQVLAGIGVSVLGVS